MVRAGHREGVDHHAAHGIQVGVVEHDALGAARCAAGVDQQGEGVVADKCRLGVGVGPRGQLGGRKNGAHGSAELEWLVDDQYLRARVFDLIAGLRCHQCRADRRDSGAQAPGGEQRDDEFGLVGQHDRHQVAGRYTVLTHR